MKRLITTSLVVVLFCSGYVMAGTWTTLDKPGASWTQPYGIDNGNIVGNYRDTSGDHGFLYNGTNWTNLDAPGSNEQTYLYDIDGSNIVGRSESSAHSFLYNGTNWTILDIPGAGFTFAQGIDGSNIVGYCADNSGWHGFLYNGTSWTTLNYPGATYTCVNGIDGSNIVGYYKGAFSHQGFIYTIPEPATLFLLALGGLVLRRRK